MESALLSLFSLIFLVFAFGIAIVVIGLRAIVEGIFKRLGFAIPDKLEDILADIWKEWILPAAPIVIGGLLAFFLVDYPYPPEFATSDSGRVFFGLIAGFFSSSVYRFAKFHIKKYLPQQVQEKVQELESKINTNTEE